MSTAISAAEVNRRRHVAIGVTTLCEIIGISSFALRLLARRISKANLWWDDYIMGIGLFFASIPGICIYVGLHFGLGIPIKQNPEIDTQHYLITLYVLELAYTFTLPITKISVLFFYYRIFSFKQYFRWAIYGVGIYLLLYLLSGVLVFVMQCLPTHAFWQPNIPHHCVDRVNFYIAHGALNFVADLTVVLMPLPLLLKLQLPRHQKLGLVILFLLGGIACAVSLWRIVSLKLIDPENFTYSSVGPSSWSMAEAEVWVLSGNIPLLRPLFRHAGILSGMRSRSARTPSDEENSYILRRSFTKQSAGRLANLPQSTYSRIEFGQRMPNGKAGADFRDDLPHNRIMVDTDLEQKVHDRGMEAQGLQR